MINGVLILDKPSGMSSNQALQKAKRLLKAKKAGHTGSLDPLASGLLPICFGEATKFSQYLLNADKTYVTQATLGKKTTTGDAEGEVIAEKSVADFSTQNLEQVLKKFLGNITQIPPMYSALKHQGKPLYRYARQGVEIEREAREVTIHKITLLDWCSPHLLLEVSCSKGTYIRTLVEDIGEALGCGAHVSKLRRISAGPFTADQMIELESLETGAFELLPIDILLTAYPTLNVSEEQTTRLYHGQSVRVERPPCNVIALYSPQGFIGTGSVDDAGMLSVKRLLCLS